MRVDHDIVSMLNAAAEQQRIFRAFVVFGARPLIFLLALFAISVATMRAQLLATAVLALVLTFAGNYGIAWIAFRSRPKPPEVVRLIAEPLSKKALPSDHAALAMVFASVISAAYPRLAWIAYPAAVFVGFSRIAVGVHYPSDVAAGFLVGLVSFLFARWLIRSLW